MRVLQTEKERNKGYAGLIQEFERIVVQSTTMYERATKREVTNSAILFLEQLIFEEEKRLSLARDWFASSGYDETNPATLLGFVRFIGSDTQSLRELIRELGPPAKP